MILGAIGLLLVQTTPRQPNHATVIHRCDVELAPSAYIPRCNMMHSWHALAQQTTPLVTLESRPRAHNITANASGAVQAIWQTAKSRTGVALMVACFHDSWDRHSPDWEHAVLDDADMFAIMSEQYDADFMRKFRDLPLGVMRADVFRCAFKTYEKHRSCPNLTCVD